MLMMRTVFVAIVVGLAACAPTRQAVNLSPQLPEGGTLAPVAVNAALQVQDERSEAMLGRRGETTLYTEQNVSQVLHEALVPALAARRIQVVTSQSDRTLTVVVKSLKLESGSGVWTAKAELASVARNGNAQYKANYRVEKDKKALLNPGAREVENVLNDVLSNALLKLVNDVGLVEFLSK